MWNSCTTTERDMIVSTDVTYVQVKRLLFYRTLEMTYTQNDTENRKRKSENGSGEYFVILFSCSCVYISFYNFLLVRWDLQLQRDAVTRRKLQQTQCYQTSRSSPCCGTPASRKRCEPSTSKLTQKPVVHLTSLLPDPAKSTTPASIIMKITHLAVRLNVLLQSNLLRFVTMYQYLRLAPFCPVSKHSTSQYCYSL